MLDLVLARLHSSRWKCIAELAARGRKLNKLIPARLRLLVLTGLVVLAFAGNSLLTRLALLAPGISPGQFAGVRLLSGAVVLALLAQYRQASPWPKRADVPGIVSLSVYAVAFTFAYVHVGAATGVLILFPAVQLTIALLAIRSGTVPSSRQAFGMLLALAGIFWMLAPGAQAPPLVPGLMMALGGIAWGVYTMCGRGAQDPLALTARNFAGAVPLAIVLMLVPPLDVPDVRGVSLALASGMVTSGLGYALWYSVLPSLNVATAGAVQMLVPLVTAAGGVLWLGEPLSLRFGLVAAVIVCGIWLTTGTPQPRGR